MSSRQAGSGTRWSRRYTTCWSATSRRTNRQRESRSTPPPLLAAPLDRLPGAPPFPLTAGFALAGRQGARSVGPLVTQRRRERDDRPGRQIERRERYSARTPADPAQQPRRAADPAEAA